MAQHGGSCQIKDQDQIIFQVGNLKKLSKLHVFTREGVIISNQVLRFEDFPLFLFCLAQFYFDSFFLVSAAEAQALPVLQDQEHPQQERRQLLPEQQRQQDGAAVGRERQHRPPLQHRDGSAPHRQPPHSPRSSGHPLRASSHLAFTVTQPAAGRLSGSLFHGAHLQEAHVLRRLQPHDCR